MQILTNVHRIHFKESHQLKLLVWDERAKQRLSISRTDSDDYFVVIITYCKRELVNFHEFLYMTHGERLKQRVERKKWIAINVIDQFTFIILQ